MQGEMALNYVTDTHSLVWYFTDDRHLSKKALKSFESTVKEGQIIVPTVVLAEILFIAKKGRTRPLQNCIKPTILLFPRRRLCRNPHLSLRNASQALWQS